VNSSVKTTTGSNVMTYAYVDELRTKDQKMRNQYIVYAQRGCQEKFLASNADIVMFGGSRGGSKTASLILEVVKDVKNKNLSSIIMRNLKDDLLGVVETSQIFLAPFGKYNTSINDMTWKFTCGGALKFTYYSDVYDEFVKRFQGKQFSYIGIDEITHMPYDKFKYILTCNRNPFGIKNRIYGTCNPDPNSWVRLFIDWWIGDDGYPIEERDGVERYCFMMDDKPTSVIWGNTREEVYQQAKDIIDPLWKEAYQSLGFDKLTMFIKSATFIRGKLEENIKLISSDQNYVANLAQQNEDQRARDLDGNWNAKKTGDDIISFEHLENFYNQPTQHDDGVKRVSADVALEGGDNCVLTLFVGNHIQDIYACRHNSKNTINAIQAKLTEWGVDEKNFTYDLNGLGQMLKGFFLKATPFNNNGTVEPEFKNIHQNIKSQCAYLFAKKLTEGELSINPILLERKFSGSGYRNTPLKNILQIERKCIRANDEAADKGFTLITKKQMKSIIGHSPDFIESFLMKEIFHIKKQYSKPRGLGLL
jgi:hypothetical protein